MPRKQGQRLIEQQEDDRVVQQREGWGIGPLDGWPRVSSAVLNDFRSGVAAE